MRPFADLPEAYQKLYRERYLDRNLPEGFVYPHCFVFANTPEGHNWWWGVVYGNGDLPPIPSKYEKPCLIKESDFVPPITANTKTPLTDEFMNILNMLL